MAKKKKVTGSDIKKSLMNQLKNNNANLLHFEDLVNDYICLWKMEKELQDDIKKRGVTYREIAANRDVEIVKANTSVNELVKVNRQMLIILRDLKLTTEEKTINEENDL